MKYQPHCTLRTLRVHVCYYVNYVNYWDIELCVCGLVDGNPESQSEQLRFMIALLHSTLLVAPAAPTSPAAPAVPTAPAAPGAPTSLAERLPLAGGHRVRETLHDVIHTVAGVGDLATACTERVHN